MLAELDRRYLRRYRKSIFHYQSAELEITSDRMNSFSERLCRMCRTRVAAFTEFFLKTSVDHVNFMESLMQPDRLRARILIWAEEEIPLKSLPPRSGRVLEALLYRESCHASMWPLPRSSAMLGGS